MVAPVRARLGVAVDVDGAQLAAGAGHLDNDDLLAANLLDARVVAREHAGAELAGVVRGVPEVLERARGIG